VLPRWSLGWQALTWIEENLQDAPGEPWRPTPEQARFIVWFYALDERGRFVYSDAVLQRLKGWGKDPLLAAISAVEFVGPCRFGGWSDAGEPIGVEHPQAWIQLAAVSKDQTRNTMTLFPALFTQACIDEHGIDIGKEIIYAHGGARRIEAVTSSPRALEGGRPTFVGKNETHHWLANNEGHEMAAVIDRNATKSKGGQSRTLSVTNAYEPHEDSVAQLEREAHEEMGDESTTMYDSIEAHPDAPLDDLDLLPKVIEGVRGDSWWLDTESIVKSILNPRNPPSRSRRFWLNQIVATEDAWLDPGDILMCGPDHLPVPELQAGDEIVLFFDGGKSDDATGLVGCRVDDGAVFTLGMWKRPPGKRGENWTAPRAEIDARVDELMGLYNVVALWGDPSHAKDDETDVSYWDATLDGWHRRYCDRLEVWAVPGKTGHAVLWDMASPSRMAAFTQAAMQMCEDVEAHSVPLDGDKRLVAHLRNARRAPNRFGISIRKHSRESAKKIDLAVCAVGARMLRRAVLNRRAAEPPKRERTGRVYY